MIVHTYTSEFLATQLKLMHYFCLVGYTLMAAADEEQVLATPHLAKIMRFYFRKISDLHEEIAALVALDS